MVSDRLSGGFSCLTARWLFCSAALFFQLLLLAGVASPQSPDSSSQADVVKERIDRELKKQEEPSSKEPSIQVPPEPAAPVPPESPRFLVQQITVRGNAVISTAELDFLIAPLFQSREMTLRELQGLPEVIQREYRRRGYLTTVAYLPPQKIEEGKVVIEVLEGRFGDLQIEGNQHFKEAQVRRYWSIRSGQVLRYQQMKRCLRRMNANPDRKVQALLRPGVTTGTTNVVLRVEDRSPIHPGFFVDQRGTKAIGLQRFGGTLRHSNLLGRDDSLLIGFVGGQFFGAGFGQYSVPLGPFGTRLILSASHAQVAPRRQFKRSGVNGTSETYSIALGQSLLSSDQARVDLKGGLDVMESRTKVFSSVTRRDRLRVVRLEPEARFTDSQGVWSFGPQLAFGLGGLGASKEDNPLASRPHAKPDFVKFKLEATRAQRMPWSTQAILSVTGQLAASKLTPQEELYLGGATSVRGYPEGDYLADDGFFSRFDYLVPIYFIPPTWRIPGFEESLKDSLNFVAFVDRGYGQLRGITGEEHIRQNLMGLGIGFVFQTKECMVRVEYAFNVGDDPLTDDSHQFIHFRIQNEF